MSKVAPVIKPSYSEPRYTTARATSSAFPARSMGIPAIVAAADS